MKLFVILTVLFVAVTLADSDTVSWYQGGHGKTAKSNAESEYVPANSLNSGDNSFNKHKYMSNTYKNVIKRDAPQTGDLSGPSQGPGNEPATTEASYPGYHGSEHIMVIPPRSASRKHRAIENYGTQNEIDTPAVKLRNDTFGHNAYENVLISLYVWQLLQNLKQTENYDLYHYFNRPVGWRGEVVIPAARIDQCQERNSSLCLEGHLPICTRDDTIHCVVKLDAAVDCSSKYSQQYCAKAQVPCMGSDEEDTSCTETLLIPCMSRVSVDMRMIGVNIRYCGVTYSTRKVHSKRADVSKESSDQMLNKL